ncbi:MAG TPA: isochorismatase family protein [Pseudonocardiaceae bacterium]|jgi:nicotinamidase-related amidase|nr:isochorismatase family protein [Pseudonocardiaceae bacterium]
MPVSSLDPRTALIVVDLQRGTVANPTAHEIGPVVAHAVDLLAAFRGRGLPVVLTNVTGTPAGRTEHGAGSRVFPPEWSELIPELDQQPEDITVTRNTWAGFAGTDLDARLAQLGMTQVVLVGLATSFGVESTARYAYDHGYHVALAVDAMTDPSAAAHQHSVQRVFPVLGQTGTTAEFLSLLGES